MSQPADEIAPVAAEETKQENANTEGAPDHIELMSYHDNEVMFNLSINIRDHPDYYERFDIYGGGAKYTITDYDVTSGQDPSGHVWVGQEHNLWPGGYFAFNLGRKGSGGVANWWSNKIYADHNTFNHNPDSLNFAFLGTLIVTLVDTWNNNRYITTTFEGVGFAQGHAGGSNNWWFGGQNGWRYRDGYVCLSGKDLDNNTVTMEFQRGDGNVVNEVLITDVILSNEESASAKETPKV